MEELRRFNIAIDYLRARPTTSVAQVATHVGLSESYLGDLFKRHIGQTPGKFKSRHQLRHLARELRYRKESVTGLWMESELSSVSELTRAIKRAYGYSPRDIQKGALPCLNPSRALRLPLHLRFARGARPVGWREPEIVDYRALRLAYKRTFKPMSGGDPQQDLLDLFRWATRKSIPLFRPWGPFGICHDDFDLDPIPHFVYECCVALPDWFTGPFPPWMGVYVQAAGTYASVRFEGDLAGEEDVLDYFYAGWLPRSGYRLDKRPGLEVFLTESALADWSRLQLNLLFPIKKK